MSKAAATRHNEPVKWNANRRQLPVFLEAAEEPASLAWKPEKESVNDGVGAPFSLGRGLLLLP